MPAPNSVTAVVLAGGFGTRIRHLLRNLPKPMAPVNGRPFVEWVVRYLAVQGVRQIILSTGYLAETVDEHFRSRPVRGVEVICVPENKPLGTAGGFLNAIAATGKKSEAWLVMNGDSLALAPLGKMTDAMDSAGGQGAILGVPMPDASRYGTIEQNPTGWLTGFREKQPGAGTINAGIYLFRESVTQGFPDRLPLSFETDVFPALIARRTLLKVCAIDAPFLDIGTPESLPLAEAFVAQNAKWFDAR